MRIDDKLGIKELATALKEAQKELPVLRKDKQAHHGSYADLEQVITKSRDVLSKHGLVISQLPSFSSAEPTLETVLMHESGQYLTSTMKLFVTKGDSQGHGAAITYAKRQAWKAIIGMAESDEDDDGDSTRVITVQQKRLLFGLARKHQGVNDETGFETLIHGLTGKTSDRILEEEYEDIQDQIKTGEIKGS